MIISDYALEIKQSGFSVYGHEPFIREIKRVLDEFSLKLTPELKDMYKLKYREKRAFGEFYNVVAPTSYIVALNNELNTIVSKIERPQPRLYA
ncbi:hypothetical protein [Leuconostoc citreum]|uniref:hypothetical protein n=1 Tax=Leuconostoc citreum TaxID=33964 RepID=UPI0021823AC8|nr:hypothetical protein [Leuconostoc citreum]